MEDPMHRNTELRHREAKKSDVAPIQNNATNMKQKPLRHSLAILRGNERFEMASVIIDPRIQPIPVHPKRIPSFREVFDGSDSDPCALKLTYNRSTAPQESAADPFNRAQIPKRGSSINRNFNPRRNSAQLPLLSFKSIRSGLVTNFLSVVSFCSSSSEMFSLITEDDDDDANPILRGSFVPSDFVPVDGGVGNDDDAL